MTLSMKTFSVVGLFATLGINDIQRNVFSVVMLSIVTLSVIRLNVVRLSVVAFFMLSVIMMNVVMPSVVAPNTHMQPNGQSYTYFNRFRITSSYRRARCLHQGTLTEGDGSVQLTSL